MEEAMRIKRIVDILLSGSALVVLLVSLTACDTLLGEDEEDGTLTVTVNNIDTSGHDWGIAGVFASGADPEGGDRPLAGNYVALTSTTVTAIARTFDESGNPTTTAWEGTGGTKYDVYIFASNTEPSGDLRSTLPGSGDVVYANFPVTYTQNGNKTITADANQFVPY
jgi:hypothetical protein